MQTKLHNYNHTKIIATLGPASESSEMIQKLIRAGADCFRLNFSHKNAEEFEPVIQRIRGISKSEDSYIPIIADIQGPKLRIGRLPVEGVILKDNDTFTITARDIGVGNAQEVETSYKNLSKDAVIGGRILLSDGTIELSVEKISDTDISCRVLIGGTLFSNKGMNLPGAKLSIDTLTEKDIKDLKFIAKSDIDMIAVSFVRSAEDIKRVREIIGNTRTPVIAKLERPEALENLDEILEQADGALIARGDLGVETPFETVPYMQKQILERSAAMGKWVTVATQMLLSMVRHNRPSRAEVSDVSNAVIDGADAIMLSEETAIGSYPVSAVEAMVKIAKEAEKNMQNIPPNIDAKKAVFSVSAAGAAVSAAERLGAKAIMPLAGSGLTALHISKWRPGRLILALSANESTLRRLNVLRGVIPVYLEKHMDMENQIKIADQFLLERNCAIKGDTVVIVAAVPLGKGAETNTIRFHRVKGA
ncbi:MAG: pyruvate kinase [Spirochaetia bacterium]|nr:pyruvate kinase [Spirochaetia bacterium]